MLKKIVAILLAGLLLMTGTEAFAANSGACPAGPSPDTGSGTQSLKDRADEIQPYMEQIRAKREELERLREQAIAACKQAKEKIKAMIENKENLTPEQIEKAKQVMESIRKCNRQIGETIGSVARECLMLRAAVRNRSADDTIAALNRIMTVQTTRITNINKAISDMKAIMDL